MVPLIDMKKFPWERVFKRRHWKIT